MSTAATETQVWQLDPAHSQIGFRVKHMMVSTVRGNFRDFSVRLSYDPANVEAAGVEVELQAASIDTGVEARDDHLRSADFFDAEKYPVLRFVSRKVEQVGDGEVRVTGDLTIRDITREVVIEGEVAGPQKDPWGNMKLGVSGATKINRKDFELTWNQVLESGGVLVADDIKIELELQFSK